MCDFTVFSLMNSLRAISRFERPIPTRQGHLLLPPRQLRSVNHLRRGRRRPSISRAPVVDNRKKRLKVVPMA